MKNFILPSIMTVALSLPSLSCEIPNDPCESIPTTPRSRDQCLVLPINSYKYSLNRSVHDFSTSVSIFMGGISVMGSLMPRSPLHNFLAPSVGLFKISRGSLLGTGLFAAGTFGILFNKNIFPETKRDDQIDKWKLRSQYASILALGVGATALHLSPSTSYLKCGIRFVGITARFGVCMVGGVAFMAASTLTISAINYMVLTPFIGTIEKINTKKKESE